MLDPEALEGVNNYPEIIYRFYKEWDSLRIQFPTLPRPLETNENQADAKARREELLAVGPDLHHTKILAWWKRWGARLSGYERALTIYSLLAHVDSCLLYTRIYCHRFGEDLLILGPRWWNRREIEINQTPLVLYDGGTASRDRFYHIRRISAKYIEEVSAEKLWTAKYTLPNDEFRVGLAALSGKAKTYFDGSQVIEEKSSANPGKHGYFATHIACSVDSPQEGDLLCQGYQKELGSIAARAVDSKVNVFCLPELCVCPQGREVLRGSFTSGHILLVVAGSFHEPYENSHSVPAWQNTAPVWRLKYGKIEEVCLSHKSEPFDFATPSRESPAGRHPTIGKAVQKAHASSCGMLAEDIVRPGKVALIKTPLGLWGVLICRDAIYSRRELIDPLRCVADHLIVISMTQKGAEDFRSFGKTQNKDHLCAVYYVNAAQFLDEKGNQGLHVACWLPSRVTETIHQHRQEVVSVLPAATPDELALKIREEEGFYLFSFTTRGIVS